MFVNMTKKKIQNFLTAILAYLQGALRKKQFTASFEEHFKENLENTIYVYFARVVGVI